MALLWRWQDQKSNYPCTLSTWLSPLGKKQNKTSWLVQFPKAQAFSWRWVWVTDFLFNSFHCRGSSCKMPLLLTSYLSTKYTFMKAWSVGVQSSALLCLLCDTVQLLKAVWKQHSHKDVTDTSCFVGTTLKSPIQEIDGKLLKTPGDAECLFVFGLLRYTKGS